VALSQLQLVLQRCHASCCHGIIWKVEVTLSLLMEEKNRYSQRVEQRFCEVEGEHQLPHQKHG
jgi:hypothetical protein